MSKNVTWSAFIPLIGGFPLAAYEATGNYPTQVISTSAFKGNDTLYLNYLASKGVEPELVDYKTNPEQMKKVDILVCTPPCAGLSVLSPIAKGTDRVTLPINQFMFDCITEGVKIADVIVLENAPTLFSAGGDGVYKKLCKIANSAGYATAIYKTSTEFHGIPQKRHRTFFFAFKSGSAPFLPWIRKDRVSYSEFIASLEGSNLPNNNDLLNPNVNENLWFKFLKQARPNSYRELLGKFGTAHMVVQSEPNLMNECLEWAKTNVDEKGLKHINHAITKVSAGSNIWDSTPSVVSTDTCGAWTSKMFSRLHPIEDRSLSVRELMRFMGMPDDFIINPKDAVKITQNVPVCTAKTMVEFATSFINGETDETFILNARFDNIKRNIEKPII